MHLESVKLMVDEFARLVLPLGTTAVVADPHEIANVLGVDGVHWLLDATSGLQLDIYFMAPSCVPASPFESPRRALTPGDLESLMRRRRVLGLAEMMNFPGVVAGAPSELEKLALDGAAARRRARAGVAGARAAGVCGRRHLLGPRGADGRGGARTAARRDVAAHPRGVDGAQPARAAASGRGVRPGAHRVLHGRSRSGGHRGLGPRERDGPRGGRGGYLARGRRAHGLASPRAVARPRAARRDRARVRRGPARAARPRRASSRRRC